MRIISRLTLDSLWLLIARISAQACSVIVAYLLARHLGVMGFGEYSFIAAAIMIGNVVTTFGTDMYIIREIAAKSDFSHLSSACTLQIALSVLFICIVFILTPSIPNQSFDAKWALRIYSLALIPLAFFSTFTSVLRGIQKMRSYAWLNIIIPVVQVMIVLAFTREKTSLVLLASLMVSLQLLGAIVAGIFCSSYIPVLWSGLQLSFQELISLVKLCFPIALIAILGVLYQKASLSTLTFLGSASMVGAFSAAIRVVEAARIGHIAAFTTLYPAISVTRSSDSFQQIFRFSRFLLIGAVGISAGLFLLAEPMVYAFFGPSYLEAIPVLKILSVTLIPYTINSTLSLMFLAKKNESVVVRVMILSLLILFVLNLVLIPGAGPIGAGWAVLSAEVLQAIFFLVAWRIRAVEQKDIFQSQGVARELSDLS